MTTRTVRIGTRTVGPGSPAYVVAEMSANHDQDFERARETLHAAKESGADAVKIQTYTPDTMTVDVQNDWFRIQGTAWDGRYLHELYREAYTPWDWQPKLLEEALGLGIQLFSTPFDITAVEFLEKMDVPAHKVASFEVVDLPLLRKIGETGKPVIMSTGMATLDEISEAVQTLRSSGTEDLILLKCTSGYPSSCADMNLITIPSLSEVFDVPAGLSDHSLDVAVPIAAVTLGACLVEKHFTVSRDSGGPDSGFSLEPKEFEEMVQGVRSAEAAVGRVRFEPTEAEAGTRALRRSLFVVEDVAEGEPFTETNVRSIRPGYGLAPKYLSVVVGRRATRAITKGEPLSWDHLTRGG